MERKAWWAAGTLGVLLLAGLVTAGIAVHSRAGDDDDEDRVVFKDKDKRVVRVRVPKAERGAFLGVRTSEDTETDQGGARVDAVVENSPAERAGIEEGDVIVSFDGARVRGPMSLTEQIHKAKAKEKVRVEVLRDGDRESFDVELGERATALIVPRGGETFEVPLPDTKALEEHLKGLDRTWGNGANAFVFRWGNRPKLGVQLVETTPELREHLGGGRDRGVLVGKVMANTPAEKAGVRVGDLIVSLDGEQVSDAGELIEALEDKDGKTVQIEVVREGRTVRLEAAIPEQEDDEDEGSGPRAFGFGWEGLDALDGDRRVAVQRALEEARVARTAALQAGRDARREALLELRAAREAQRDALQAEREAMRQSRQQLRRELVRARRAMVI